MDFYTLALKIADSSTSLSVRETLYLTRSLLPLFPEEEPQFDYTPKSLAIKALTIPEVHVEARGGYGRKIAAIKALRFATKCGIAEAKNAVEHPIFTAVYPEFTVTPQPPLHTHTDNEF